MVCGGTFACLTSKTVAVPIFPTAEWPRHAEALARLDPMVEIEYNKTNVLESSLQDCSTQMIRLTLGDKRGGLFHRHIIFG